MFKHESFVLFHLNTFVTEQIEELYSVFSKKGKRQETEQVGVKSSFNLLESAGCTGSLSQKTTSADKSLRSKLRFNNFARI